MGGKNSKTPSTRIPPDSRYQSVTSAPSHHQASTSRRRLDQKYSRIPDDYETLEQVTSALAEAGLESSNLIVGIDFTKSNEWTGKTSFKGKSLHNINGMLQNPYEEAISIIGQTLAAFDEDNLIPCFGFGDASTHDTGVFSFYPDSHYCQGFEDVLMRYKEIVPQLKLAGPTSFAPIIETAITIVEETGGQYHVLLIIADGQVTRSVDTEHGHFSTQERNTIDAIVKASSYPLSIILVGVGDGPWDMMKEFDDNIPSRAFDNLQFVNFTDIMSKNIDLIKKRTEFALTALMEIPSQYQATLQLGLLGARTGYSSVIVPLPPPGNGRPTSFAPIIETAIKIVEESGGQYHVLLIIADGQVTRSVDTEHGHFSTQERNTIDAIVKASYPLSIILVGVGDGPWDMMKEFDDNIPSRAFDNLQFVNFTDIMSKNIDPMKKRTEFALTALMEIPSQYQATLQLGLLGARTGYSSAILPLPPPGNGSLRN
ncbi:hypothetical protein SSX86_007237 [Deinandra increscens subsp. villosa]|uniref:VWFA domain-containing protein n=1 Tax=Deinandra increscens subsp. villosa TaxID=3103831 RepID=A0AAP0H6C2_9ASTR